MSGERSRPIGWMSEEMAEGKCPVTVPEWHKRNLVTLSSRPTHSFPYAQAKKKTVTNTFLAWKTFKGNPGAYSSCSHYCEYISQYQSTIKVSSSECSKKRQFHSEQKW